MMTFRNGKQCRERWYNHLRPNITKGLWNEDEEKILIEAHREVGNKWAKISERLPWRSQATIKNHWNNNKRYVKRQENKCNDDCNETPLQNYIREVIAIEEVEKDGSDNNFGLKCDHHA